MVYTYEKIKTFERGQATMQDDFRWTNPLISEIVILHFFLYETPNIKI